MKVICKFLTSHIANCSLLYLVDKSNGNRGGMYGTTSLPGLEFGLSCERSRLSCDRFGLSCNRSGLSCDRFGLSCARFGLSCDRSGLSCDRFGLKCPLLPRYNGRKATRCHWKVAQADLCSPHHEHGFCIHNSYMQECHMLRFGLSCDRFGLQFRVKLWQVRVITCRSATS